MGRRHKRQKVEKDVAAKASGRLNKRRGQQDDEIRGISKPSKKSGPMIVKSSIVLSGLSTDEKCDLIAELSEVILEDPTKAFHSEKETFSKQNQDVGGKEERKLPSKMHLLLELSRTQKNGNDEYIATLAIMSLLAIFQDVLPSYRIRQQTEIERQSKISRETKTLWDYERNLLTHYQQFLHVLEKAWEQGQSQPQNPSRVAITSMLSMCELLKSAYHFNFRSNILVVVVRQMNNRYCDQVSESCCRAVEYVFEKDTQGEVAMEAARHVAKLVKDYRGILRPGVVRSFAKLPLRVHVDEAEAAKLAAAANAKKRKKDRELAEIESELKESSGTVDKIVLARCQLETLQSVILTYFRILKSSDTKTRQELLPAALEGLAKFSHLINIDTVVDLLDALKELLVHVDTLPLEASLNCVLTAFHTLQGPGREMQIDQKEYITPLYRQLARVGTEKNSRRNTKLLLQCLTLAFIKRKEYSTVRVAAFVRQIFAVSMHAPVYTSVPLLALARQILQRYPSTHQLLESESDVITAGEYTPDVVDPEHSNPFSTSAWELACLIFHAHPAVREQADAAAKLKMVQLPAEAPDRLFNELSQDTDKVYISYQRFTKKHPLAGKGSGKNQLRFLTPRKAKITLIST
jgi:nucleolar complex protein 3